MLDYAKKRAVKIEMSLLRYMGAFSEGVLGMRNCAYKDNPKQLRAYRDGVRMKKRLDSK